MGLGNIIFGLIRIFKGFGFRGVPLNTFQIPKAKAQQDLTYCF